MTFKCEGVLLLSCEMEVTDQVLRRISHDEAAHWIGQAKLHTRHRLEMPWTKTQKSGKSLSPILRFSQSQIQFRRFGIVEQWNAAHRFDAAGDEGPGFTELNELRRRRQCFHAGSTVALHAMGNAITWNAGQQRNDARDIGGVGRHGDVAEDDLIDLLRT